MYFVSLRLLLGIVVFFCLVASPAEGKVLLSHRFSSQCTGAKGKMKQIKRVSSLCLDLRDVFRSLKGLAPPGVCLLRVSGRYNVLEVIGTQTGIANVTRLLARDGALHGPAVGVYPLRHRSVKESDLKTFFKQCKCLRGDTATNSVVIRGTLQLIRLFKSIFKRMDTPRHQRFLGFLAVWGGRASSKGNLPLFSHQFELGPYHQKRFIETERVTLKWKWCKKGRVCLVVRQYLNENQGPWKQDHSPSSGVRTIAAYLTIRRGEAISICLKRIQSPGYTGSLRFLLGSVTKFSALSTQAAVKKSICLKVTTLAPREKG